MSYFIRIIFIILFIRTLTILFIGKIPCMENLYWMLGSEIINNKVETINLVPLYSIILFLLDWIFNNLFLTSSLIFIFSSTIISIFIYLICDNLYDKKTAKIALILSLFYPSISVSIAGYSHTVIFTVVFEIIAFYFLLIFLKNQKLNLFIPVIFFSIITIYLRPEYMIVVFSFTILILLFQIYIDKN